MNLKEIKEMLQLMKEHNLGEIEIEKDGLKIKLKKSNGFGEEMPSKPLASPMTHTAAMSQSAHAEPASQVPKENANVALVRSPMVGTFYTAPAPDQPAYVGAGDKVKEGTVLCIIEAMKLMNEIKSEVTGTVLEVLVKNGQPVEFDQPLFKVQKG